MISLTIEMDENGNVDSDSLSDQIFINITLSELKSCSFNVSTELSCLNRCGDILENGPFKYSLIIIDAIGKYDLNKNNRKFTLSPNEEMDEHEMLCDRARERIQRILENL